jgi:hypothetical protein
MRDGGGPSGIGDQVADPKPPQAAIAQKTMVVNVVGKARTESLAGEVERGERK